MRQGEGAEEKLVSGGVIDEELVEGSSGLWRFFGFFDGFQVYGKGDDSR